MSTAPPARKLRFRIFVPTFRLQNHGTKIEISHFRAMGMYATQSGQMVETEGIWYNISMQNYNHNSGWSMDFTQLHDRDSILRFLVKLGNFAGNELQKTERCPAVEWNTLLERFFTLANPPVPDASRRDYERWLNELIRWAEQHQINEPAQFSAGDAALYAKAISARGTSPIRRFRFFKRVWSTLGLCETIFALNILDIKPNEHYRRLSMDEIRRLLEVADDAEMRDIIVLGYWTGLRLSDIVELDRDEIELSRCALRLIPNKVRHRHERINLLLGKDMLLANIHLRYRFGAVYLDIRFVHSIIANAFPAMNRRRFRDVHLNNRLSFNDHLLRKETEDRREQIWIISYIHELLNDFINLSLRQTHYLTIVLDP